MEDFINWLSGFLSSVLQWFVDLIKSILQAFLDIGMDVFILILDGLLAAAVALLNSIQFDASQFNFNQYLQGAPAEFLGMLVAIGVPQAMGIIVAAILIRFALQLIPFIRLGS